MTAHPPRYLPPIDPLVWRACAGPTAQIPRLNSVVYYFPEGHAEQTPTKLDFSSLPHRRPFYRCHLASVTFHANPDTDEVYAKFGLDPRTDIAWPPPVKDPNFDLPVVSFAKILTPSDANNGGGFSVPRFCAESILPELDMKADPPVQNIHPKDVHGNVSDFRHIYRGTPRRHLLTTGWSGFVNEKKLVAGDSVIFIRNLAGELVIGLRRAKRSCMSSIDYMFISAAKVESVAPGQGFSRNVRGRVPSESVMQAIKLAEMNRPFDVLYYPRAGSPDIVVEADLVEAALRVQWVPGLRIKMSVETEDSSTVTWFQGTVSGTAVHEPDLWPGSPWRMLQVTLDEPKVLHNVKSVNPWQVEIASPTFQLPPAYQPNKRLRTSTTSELPNDVESSIYFPVATGYNSTVMGNLNPPMFNYSNFPVGMQGARHNSSSESSLSNLPHKNTLQLFSSNFNGNNAPEKLNAVSTDLSIGSTSRSDSISPRSQSSPIHHYGTEVSGTAVNKSSRESKASFQLFGKIIHVDQHFNSDAGKEHKEVKDAAQSVDISFPYHPE